MKKILILFVIGVLVLTLVGCTNEVENDSINIGEKSKYIISNDLVSLEIKQGSLTKSKVTVVFINHTDDTYIYGEPYFIEYEKDGIWYRVNPIIKNYGFNMIAYNLNPKDTKEKQIDWEWLYGNLIAGKYRVITYVFPELDRAVEPSDYVYIGVEFIIE